MHRKGRNVKDIAAELNISYSAVYHWIKGLRKPGAGNLREFEDAVRKGPVAAAEIKESFPKHNELFLVSAKRGLPIKRHVLGRKYGEYSTWYFLEGHEDALKERIKELLGKYKELKTRLLGAIGETGEQ